MPTVARIRGVQIGIYPKHHGSPHLCAAGAKGEAVFLLNYPDEPPTLRQSMGLNEREVRSMPLEGVFGTKGWMDGLRECHGTLAAA